MTLVLEIDAGLLLSLPFFCRPGHQIHRVRSTWGLSTVREVERQSLSDPDLITKLESVKDSKVLTPDDARIKRWWDVSEKRAVGGFFVPMKLNF